MSKSVLEVEAVTITASAAGTGKKINLSVAYR